MKKFLSICLVALCSVSAMYAQNASTDQRPNVPNTTNVSVEATAKTGFYHFVEWEIKNGGNLLLKVDQENNFTYDPTNNASNKNYGATVTPGVTNTGLETSTLTLNPIGCDLVNAATSGTVTFEAFFEIDKYTITGTTDGGGTVDITGVDANGQATGEADVTITANPDNCSKFDHWEAVGNPNDPNNGSTNPNLAFTTPATWEHGSTHEYKAVFVPKTVNIYVTTADDNKGTVRIVTPAPANPQQ